MSLGVVERVLLLEGWWPLGWLFVLIILLGVVGPSLFGRFVFMCVFCMVQPGG